MTDRPLRLPDREVMYRTVLAHSRLIQSDPDAVLGVAEASRIRAMYTPCGALGFRCALTNPRAPTRCEGTAARCGE